MRKVTPIDEASTGVFKGHLLGYLISSGVELSLGINYKIFDHTFYSASLYRNRLHLNMSMFISNKLSYLQQSIKDLGFCATFFNLSDYNENPFPEFLVYPYRAI